MPCVESFPTRGRLGLPNVRQLPRWLLFTVMVLVLVVGALTSLAAVTVRDSFPQVRGSVTLPSLRGKAVVQRDASGIPQIYADTPEDLFAAQGYVHAQERFFEMDVRRHITSGRLSELFGESQFETDAYLRTLGWRRVAEQEYQLLGSAARRYLEAYAGGVNDYIDAHPTGELALEYPLLAADGLTGYRPEPWTPVDCLAWLKAMAWQLDRNWSEEVELAVATKTVGPQQARSLFPAHDSEVFDPVVTSGAVVGDAFDPAAIGHARTAPQVDVPELTELLTRTARAKQAIPRYLGDPESGRVGSNSWAVSGERTATGRPILANDPHLATSIPSTFMQLGLHCGRVSEDCPYDVAGFSFSGMPGIVIGHNGDISWGFTSPELDTQDLVIEEIRDGWVRRAGDPEPVTVRLEDIKVRGGGTRTITIRSTSNGPLLSDVEKQVRAIPAEPSQTSGAEHAVALSWTALTPTNSLEAIFGINRASNFTEFREAARLLKSPSQNLMYADTAGNVGYQLPGDFPIRRSGAGEVPLAGWDAASGWAGSIPFDKLPYAYNPPQGYLVSANQPIVEAREYPYQLGRDGSYGWRSQQIIDSLNQRQGRLSVADAEQIFYDPTVRYAGRIVPSLLRAEAKEDWVADGQKVLAAWDYRADSNSGATAFFNITMKHVVALTFRDQLPPEVWPSGGDRWYAVIADLLRDPENPWWDKADTIPRETRDTILSEALVAARKEATVLMSRDPQGWNWGNVHRLRLRNQTLGRSGVPPVEAVFNRGNYPVGGGNSIVMAWSWEGDQWGYAVTNGPTMRMVVDLGDLDNSRWVNQSGTSGHAFHPNYDDQLALIATNRTLAWPFSRPRVEQAATDRLELLPGL